MAGRGRHTGTPGEGAGRRAPRRADTGLVAARPTLFGYQHVPRHTPHAQDVVRLEVNSASSARDGAKGVAIGRTAPGL